MFDDDFDLEDAIALGTGYALLRHGQDRQTAAIVGAIQSLREDEPVAIPEDPLPPINNLDYVTEDLLEELEDYIGQEPLKRQLMVYVNSAKMRGASLPHILLASGYPGVGKTTMARLLAKLMGVKIVELVPPFKIDTLVNAAENLDDRDILFIDEIHKLADSGARGAEILLKVLEDHVAYLPDGTVVQLANITVVGATTEPDKLPEPVLDRFKVKPYFQPYSLEELGRIAITFAFKRRAEDLITDDLAYAIADASRNTPRIIDEMVMAARDLALLYGRPATPKELLEFLEVEPDGLTRTHIHYLTAMRQYFAREARDGSIEYIVGEAAIQQILRETKQGVGRIERFLVERGLLDRTPRGRRLTAAGIARAEQFIAAGKGAADIA